MAKNLPKNRTLSETEWRSIGVQQSRGWDHYACHRPEPHILLFRRPLGTVSLAEALICMDMFLSVERGIWLDASGTLCLSSDRYSIILSEQNWSQCVSARSRLPFSLAAFPYHIWRCDSITLTASSSLARAASDDLQMLTINFLGSHDGRGWRGDGERSQRWLPTNSCR